MPIISIEEFDKKVSVGLWKMTEAEEDLYNQYPFLNEYGDLLSARYRSEARRKEFLCVHILLALMTGDEHLRVGHLPSGKPQLDNGMQISISHTKGYAAVILSENHNVAIDIEHRSDRVQRIAHRFIREDENATTILAQLLHWSAKETLYKYFSETPLEYFDMRLQPFEVKTAGNVVGENLKSGASLPIRYCVTEDYVLTYAF